MDKIMISHLKCDWCEANIFKRKQPHNILNFCNRECRDKYTSKRRKSFIKTFKCIWCDKSFKRNSRVVKSDKIFCSKSCSIRYSNTNKKSKKVSKTPLEANNLIQEFKTNQKRLDDRLMKYIQSVIDKKCILNMNELFADFITEFQNYFGYHDLNGNPKKQIEKMWEIMLKWYQENKPKYENKS